MHTWHLIIYITQWLISDFQHIFRILKFRAGQRSPEVAETLTKIVGATGIEPVTPAV